MSDTTRVWTRRWWNTTCSNLEKIHQKMATERASVDRLTSYQNGFLFVGEKMLNFTREKLGSADDNDADIIQRKGAVAKERAAVMDGADWFVTNFDKFTEIVDSK